jgi:antitoxin (DNA-binding transcriptional repressor) of toxin-antitoxin stability system
MGLADSFMCARNCVTRAHGSLAASIAAGLTNVASRSYIYAMKVVGLRELKNRLSEYVREVRAGEEVIVTDRGQAVAELRPPGTVRDEKLPPGLLALAKAGALSLGAPNRADLYPHLPRRSKISVRSLLDHERGDR